MLVFTFILEQKKIFNKTFGNLSNNIGAIYFNKGSYDSALLSFYRTLKIYENINTLIRIYYLLFSNEMFPLTLEGPIRKNYE